jgi:hypothetical protein
MLIGDKYKLESDRFTITLSEKKIKGDKSKDAGGEWWDEIMYFSNIHNALKALVDYDLNMSGLSDLKAIADRQMELYLLIRSLPIKKEDINGTA